MSEHIHIGIVTALTTFLMLIPLFFLWRVLSIKLKDNSIGQAMSFILG